MQVVLLRPRLAAGASARLAIGALLTYFGLGSRVECTNGRARFVRLVQLLLQIGHVHIILRPEVAHRRVRIAGRAALPARHGLGLLGRQYA